MRGDSRKSVPRIRSRGPLPTAGAPKTGRGRAEMRSATGRRCGAVAALLRRCCGAVAAQQRLTSAVSRGQFVDRVRSTRLRSMDEFPSLCGCKQQAASAGHWLVARQRAATGHCAGPRGADGHGCARTGRYLDPQHVKLPDATPLDAALRVDFLRQTAPLLASLDPPTALLPAVAAR